MTTEEEYHVFYNGGYFGKTTDAREIAIWSLGKNLNGIRIVKGKTDVPLNGCNGDVADLERILRSFNPIMLESELFEI